jgi:L-aminopeptidase/D-esterase-like protein
MRVRFCAAGRDRRVEAVIHGFEIGHCTADREGWLTGTTVVLARDGAVGGVDVRGGGPGTRETDLLDPQALVEHVNAVVLTGGSAYGLAAADGVMAGLEGDGLGFRVGPEAGHIVPIVPAAVIFDLGRGGSFGHRPTADFGIRALAAARPDNPETGCVGAGTGATCGALKGGFGYAEAVVRGGVTLNSRADDVARVAAAVVVNATGSAVDPVTGRLYADRRGELATPTESERLALAAAAAFSDAPVATTIGVVLTDASLTKSQANKVAAVSHDGMARAINPLHSMRDGDTVFCLASARRPVASDPRRALLEFNDLLAAAADVFTDACLTAMVSATSRGRWLSYSTLAPSILTSGATR